MYSIKLQWLSFNVDMNTIEAWMRLHAGPDYCGNSANSIRLELWFHNQPDQSYVDAINSYWNGLTNSSTEATNYSSEVNRLAATASTKLIRLNSAKRKLENIGLTLAEIEALIGN